VHLDYLQRPSNRSCNILGDRGKIEIDLQSTSIRIFDGAGIQIENSSIPDFQGNKMFIDEIGHFLTCIAARSSPMVTVRDGLQSLKMALAAKQSLEMGEIVALQGEIS
jgi:predicted dehydrogenase